MQLDLEETLRWSLRLRRDELDRERGKDAQCVGASCRSIPVTSDIDIKSRQHVMHGATGLCTLEQYELVVLETLDGWFVESDVQGRIALRTVSPLVIPAALVCD